ncbi:PHD finger protein 14 [Thoreauomyces humboldtii]|nr:PHD finger protein 14 [Thoreauomyces humboldtii]
MCCVCNVNDHQDDLLVCAGSGCPTTVHVGCYGRSERPREASWLCDACQAPDPASAQCIFCPMKDGALERVQGSPYFVHTLCKNWIAEKRGNHCLHKDHLTSLKPKIWSSDCSLCTSPEDAKIGCKRTCNAGGCKNSVHATCASEMGCLEDEKDPDMADPFFIYCKQHGTDPRTTQWARWVKKKHQILKLQSETDSATLTPHFNTDPRIAMATYVAEMDRHQINRLAQLQRDTVRCDAESRFFEEAIRKMEAEDTGAAASASEAAASTAYKEVMAETATLQRSLMDVFHCIQPSSGAEETGRDSSPLSQKNVIDRFFNGAARAIVPELLVTDFKAAYAAAESTPVPLSITIPGRRTTTTTTTGITGTKRKRRTSFDGDSSLGICTVCKRFEGGDVATVDDHSSSVSKKRTDLARRLVQCSQCSLSFHMCCLDPPMKNRPSRGYAWRCQSCDSSPEPSPTSKASSSSPDDARGEDEEGRPKRRRVTPKRFF